jgi:hypothetical protein
MAACVNDSRIDQISRCGDELERCRAEQHKEPLATIGEMDWLEELHRLVWEWEEK